MVKKRIISFILLIFLTSLLSSSLTLNFLSKITTSSPESIPQETKKIQQDYMRKTLDRNTDPLGLQENQALDKFLSQSSIKWVIRSGKKHILN